MVSPPTQTHQFTEITLHRRDERTNEIVETVTFRGVPIGDASSERGEHRGHPTTQWAPKKVKCSACRWLEVTIFLRAEGGYVIHAVGISDVPDEVDYVRLWQTDSAFEAVELLTVRRPKPGGETIMFMPLPHARALAQASTVDDDIREAYVNRAVA